jgi:hypothetical protein
MVDPPELDSVLQTRQPFDETMSLRNETDEEVQRHEQEMAGDNQKKTNLTKRNRAQKTKVTGLFRKSLMTSSGEI